MLSILLALLSAGALVALGDLRASPLAAVGVMVAWGAGVWALPRPQAKSVVGIVLAAAAVRGLLLFSPASLSDDLFRYLWEGRVVWEGGNPYLHAPADPRWAAFAEDPILQQVNHPDVSTVYPPLTLLLFSVVSAVHYGPLAIKVLMGLCDVATAGVLARVLALRGRSLDGAWLYALLPLAAVETAGSGHVEGLGVLCLALAVLAWQRGRSGIGWAGLGGLVKLLPFAVLPALWRRSPWLFGAVAFVGFVSMLPFLDAGPALLRGLGTYATHWSFNAGGFALLDGVLGGFARPVAALLGVSAAVAALLARRDPAHVAMWVGAAFVAVSPTVHPWYALWVWVPALIVGVRAWTWLAVTIPLSYVALATLDPATGAWDPPVWPALVQYLPLVGLLAAEAWRHATRPGPWAPDRA